MPNSPLTVARNGPILDLSWGPSCGAEDIDYAVYEGTLDDPGSHVLRTCTTGGATDWTLDPQPRDSYYLVVPSDGATEGSYGADNLTGERPVSGTPCAAQILGTCP